MANRSINTIRQIRKDDSFRSVGGTPEIVHSAGANSYSATRIIIYDYYVIHHKISCFEQIK